jgi:GntR family transcriptional regulator of arabinose operon
MPTLIDRHLKIPQYLQLAEYLREQIQSGQLQPGDRLPSFNEMKAQFDAVQRTVEKAHSLLEGDGLIRREPGRGVFVNHPTPRQVTGNVGFMTPYDMSIEGNLAYWGLVLAGMRQVARENDYNVLLIDNGINFTNWDTIDGALVYNVDSPDFRLVVSLPSQDFASVSIFNEIPGTVCVTVDDFDVTYQSTRHLIELGHRRIACLMAMNTNLLLLEKRKAGYIKALTEAGIEPDTSLMRDLSNQEDKTESSSTSYIHMGEQSIRRWLKDDWTKSGCTALITQNDNVAFGAINAFKAAGLQVPGDVSVIGVDGISPQFGTMSLTTVEIPLKEIGRQAMNLLLEWLKTPAIIPQSLRLPIRFVEGSTTAPPP